MIHLGGTEKESKICTNSGREIEKNNRKHPLLMMQEIMMQRLTVELLNIESRPV